MGIRTNCTLIFSANQAILAANAGATYVSPVLPNAYDTARAGAESIQFLYKKPEEKFPLIRYWCGKIFRQRLWKD